MHTLLLVAGDKVDAELLPFMDIEIEPHEVFLQEDNVQSMAKSYGIPATDLVALAAKMRDWQKEEGFVRDGRLGRISRENPNARLDCYEVGGRWDGFLQLRSPRRLRRFFGLISAGSTCRVSSARKIEVDQHALLTDPPAAFLFLNQASFPCLPALVLPDPWLLFREQILSATRQLIWCFSGPSGRMYLQQVRIA